MRVSGEYNLAARQPELAKEWHPTKNGLHTPDAVPYRSHAKVWWICSKGHEWEATIRSRNRSAGCPYCKRTKPTPEYSLQSCHPGLVKKWHPTKNGSLIPDQTLPYSNRNAWWVCPKGHEWEARIASVTTGTDCPYCAGYRTTPENSFGALHPDLAEEWHLTKNGTLLPKDVSPFSSKKVWWVCSKGHEWFTYVFSRTRGSGCPYCSGFKASKERCLQAHNPELAKEWHPEKNGKVTPWDITPSSGHKRWWLCGHGHEWEATIANRAKGRGCPSCAGRIPGSLQTHNPCLAGEWHQTKNGILTPLDVKPGSNKRVWWLCNKGHGWIATVNSRNRGSGCPYCNKEGTRKMTTAFAAIQSPVSKRGLRARARNAV